MLYNDFTEKLLGLQGIIVKKVESDDKKIKIFIEMKRETHNCICCGTATDTIHDYRTQIIKDVPAFGREVYIILRKRRYRCPHCGKRFFKKNSFLPRYYRMTNRLFLSMIRALESVDSFTSVSRRFNVSVSTVIRIFDTLKFTRPDNLPKTVAIDEFKGNTWGEKYQCIITDPENHVVIDILPKRFSSYLSSYFSAFNNRNDVDFSFQICGNRTLIFLILSLKPLLMLLINTTGCGKLSGLLKRSEKKLKSNFQKTIVFTLNTQEMC